jgi:DNA (cytosine-5)-methyltransferase 1
VRYLSVCSGIEAASVAWNPLGWEAVAFSEIEKFPSAVLAHHYPHVPNWGDMTRYQDWDDAGINVLVGGTPCQSFSVAGLRKGLDDPRGNLMLTYGAIAQRYRPRWLVWENVPGVLSSDSGRDFGTFLGMLAQLGYGFAYRVLDAQYVRVESHARAVPQRRRRVFVVGCLGDWRRAAAVLFEPESMRGDSAPRREAGKAAPTIPSRSTAGGGLGTDFDCDGGLVSWWNGEQVADALGTTTDGQRMPDKGRLQAIVEPVGCTVTSKWAKGSGGPAGSETQNIIAIQERAVSENPDNGPDGAGVRTDGAAYTLESRTQTQAVAYAFSSHAGAADGEVTNKSHANGGPVGLGVSEELAYTLKEGRTQAIAHMAVRRLTPLECERLQGFPDDYTAIPKAKDGPRYKALGNSMAVNVMSWIGRRIQIANEVA